MWVTLIFATLLSQTANALSNLAPPKKLPSFDSLVLRDCAGTQQNLNGLGDVSMSSTGNALPLSTDRKPLALLFLDADSTFSQESYVAFESIAKKYTGINFIAILSFGLGYNKQACLNSGSPSYAKFQGPVGSGYTVPILLDKHNFYNGKFAYEYFAVSSNEILLYTSSGERFRYLPYTQTNLQKALPRTWVVTAIEELSRASLISTVNESKRMSALFLTNEFDSYPGFTLSSAGTVGKMVAASDVAACKRQCIESSCTGFTVLGLHECFFFASHGRALKYYKEKYENARLYVRKPISNVLATQQAFQGFLWGVVIIATAVVLFVCATKSNTRKFTETVPGSSLDQFGSNALINDVDNDVEMAAEKLDREEAAE